MYLLHPSEYGQVEPLFRPLDYHLVIGCILAGTAPARVWVDDPASPRAAVAWIEHKVFLVGPPQDEVLGEALHELLAGTILPRARESGRTVLSLRYDPEAWQEPLVRIARAWSPAPQPRRYYVFDKLRPGGEALLPECFALRPINAALMEERHLANLDLLKDEMRSERPSVDEFLQSSFGVCAVCGDAIAGWCTSEYNCGNRCEVGIGTLEPYRRRGLATAMGSALVGEALSRGITGIGWHCIAANVASSATALKLGFSRPRDYSTVLIWF